MAAILSLAHFMRPLNSSLVWSRSWCSPPSSYFLFYGLAAWARWFLCWLLLSLGYQSGLLGFNLTPLTYVSFLTQKCISFSRWFKYAFEGSLILIFLFIVCCMKEVEDIIFLIIYFLILIFRNILNLTTLCSFVEALFSWLAGLVLFLRL